VKRVFDHGYIKLIETWGSDERVIESARMSTAKGFLGWGPKKDGTPGDEKLLRYLWEHKHSTPFELSGATIEVQAPIFVFREWHRHRTQSYSELSARYTEVPELFYVPSKERLENAAQSKSNKQGSAPATFDTALVDERIRTASESSFFTYHELLKMGVAREVARCVLPVNTYSRMRASANLRNWLGFLSLRMDSAAQYEIRCYAEELFGILYGKFPRTMALFEEGLK